MPAPLFALVGKLALGLEFVLQPVTPYDTGLDRVLVHRAQQHKQQQFDIVRFWLIDRTRRLRLDRARLLVGKLIHGAPFRMLNPELLPQDDFRVTA